MLPYTVIYRTEKNEEVPPCVVVEARTAEKARFEVMKQVPALSSVLWVEQTDDVWNAYKALWTDRHPNIR